MRRIDLSNSVFGDWTVLSAAPSNNGETYWFCRCACGKEIKVGTKNLTTGRSVSCGCRTKEFHGASDTVEYAIWRKMLNRCNSPTTQDWALYGGRGITVEWTSFSQFVADMGPRPSPLHSIDRFPDQNGPYSKANCRWATAQEQARNTRVNRLITAFGETLCLAAWAERTGISRNCIEKRLDLLNWTVEDALTRPVR